MPYAVRLKRGDYTDGIDPDTYVDLKVEDYEQRDTREPLSMPIPLTKTRIIFDYGKFTRYVILKGYVSEATLEDSYLAFEKIETACEDWWKIALYTTLPTLYIEWSDSQNESMKCAITKLNMKYKPGHRKISYTMELLQGRETQP